MSYRDNTLNQPPFKSFCSIVVAGVDIAPPYPYEVRPVPALIYWGSSRISKDTLLQITAYALSMSLLPAVSRRTVNGQSYYPQVQAQNPILSYGPSITAAGQATSQSIPRIPRMTS